MLAFSCVRFREREFSCVRFREREFSCVRFREREFKGIRVQTCIEMTCEMHEGLISMLV
jgi:hypothetical protein